MGKSKTSPFFKVPSGISPWAIIGAVAVLTALFGYMTVENLARQKENDYRLLLEKGAALIRSFEAGTRLGMRWSGFRLQKLLSETAQQPDIGYLLITDDKGRILAHSDINAIGALHARNLDLVTVARESNSNWRITLGPGGTRVFEIYRKFTPTGKRGRWRHKMMMAPPPPSTDNPLVESFPQPTPPAIIFVGLDMRAIEAARRGDTRQILISASLLLLAAVAGILLLFLAQSYRAAKASLSRVQVFSDTLVENMPMGLLALDPHNRLSFLNPVARSILGLAPAVKVGQAAGPWLPEALSALIKSREAADGVAEKEIDFQGAAAEPIPLAVSATTLRDDAGAVLGHILLLKDLSDLQALQKEVARSQRLASLGSLAAGVAHEVRNPLSSIKGFATFFREKYGDRPNDRQAAEVMIRETDRLNRVVSQLLEFARPVSLARERASAKKLIEATLAVIDGPALSKQIEIEVNIYPQDLELNVDRDRFNQVLLNLFLNSLEAMDSGGTLRVEVTRAHNGKETEFRISDTGRGMAPADLAKVFDPYFTTKASGTGLGLAIVHNIVEAHGGWIKMASQPQKGTVVSIILPYESDGDRSR